ncbi:MAG: hypothetical protein GC149_13655 [Gammaproteobacteria bacterium]|nr:hypothetical protein [Gammaproteobacteria bacterium]
MYSLANEPQGIGRILDAGFRLFKSGLKGALGIMLIMIGSGLVLGIVMSLMMGGIAAMVMGGGGAPGQMPQFGPGSFIMLILFAIAGALFFTYFSNALILNYANIAYQRTTGIGNALSGAFSRLLPAFGAVVLLAIFLIILIVPSTAYEFMKMREVVSGETSMVTVQLVSLLLKLPYYFFAVTLAFTIYRAVIDNYGAFSSVIGSHKLVWGKFWRTTLWLLIVYVIVLVLFLVVFIPTFGSAFMFGHGGNTNASASAIIFGVLAMIVLMMFSLPFVVAMTIPYYHDLKLRKEGGDLSSRITAA